MDTDDVVAVMSGDDVHPTAIAAIAEQKNAILIERRLRVAIKCSLKLNQEYLDAYDRDMIV
ncbi:MULTISPECIES: hypothetical protein [unclassified Mesorhizobium]|uniref:hypothetical protein n=1 Tax=unclassified Mesorhizobium TaxID=325217 RepID=UPI003014ECAA